MEQDANEFYLRAHEAKQKRLAIKAEKHSRLVDEEAERITQNCDETIIAMAFHEYVQSEDQQILRAMLDDYRVAINSRISDQVAYSWLGHSFAKYLTAHIRKEAEIALELGSRKTKWKK